MDREKCNITSKAGSVIPKQVDCGMIDLVTIAGFSALPPD
jgi:hypothetical protein